MMRNYSVYGFDIHGQKIVSSLYQRKLVIIGTTYTGSEIPPSRSTFTSNPGIPGIFFQFCFPYYEKSISLFVGNSMEIEFSCYGYILKIVWIYYMDSVMQFQIP